MPQLRGWKNPSVERVDVHLEDAAADVGAHLATSSVHDVLAASAANDSHRLKREDIFLAQSRRNKLEALALKRKHFCRDATLFLSFYKNKNDGEVLG